MTIRALTPEDWPEVERIYAEGIATGNATFESAPPTWEQFDAGKLDVGRLVAVDDEGVTGWAAVSPVSSRVVYRGVVEHSVYIAERARGRGLGRQLLDALTAACDDAGIWTIQSSIFREKHHQPPPAPTRRLPPGRPPRTHRPHDLRALGRPVARHDPHRATDGVIRASGGAHMSRLPIE